MLSIELTMASKKAVFFAGRSKTKLEADIQKHLAKYEFGEEFPWPSLSDLIATKHYYCSEHGLRPLRFRKMQRPGWAYEFQGWFEGHGWHPVSWKQCIRPRRDQDWITKAIRDAIAPIKLEYRRGHPECEHCHRAPSEEVHHAHPTVDEIVSQALSGVSEEEWRAEARRWDWWSKEPYQLANDSPILVRALSLHDSAQLEALCHECHMKAESARRDTT